MIIKRRNSFLGLCCSLLWLFCVSVNAGEIEDFDSGISIESWLLEGGRELPVLSFEPAPTHESLVNDIRVENIIQEEGGSVRFQLSHSGPMSRQVFANVRRVAQDDGYTRSIITNIADGQQMEYLTRTAELKPLNQEGKENAAGLLAESGFIDDQYVECPLCVLGGYLLAEAICMLNTDKFFAQCRVTCDKLGGVKRISTGICGTAYAECVCWIKPRRDHGEF